jgi:hypothetical protein
VSTQELPPQDNLEYFLGSIGYHGGSKNFEESYMAVGVQGFFRGRIKGLVASSGNSEMAQFLDTHPHYVPKTKSEASTAAVVDRQTGNSGVTVRVDRAGATKKGSPQEAVRRTYEDAVRRWESAQEEMRIINSAKISPEDDESVPDLENIRSNEEVQTVMAEYFLAQEFLKEQDWPKSNSPKFESRQRVYGGAILALVNRGYASDEMLLQAYKQVAESCEARLSHLTKDVNALEKNEHVKENVLARRDYVPGVGFVPLQELLAEDESKEIELEAAEPEQEEVPEDRLTSEQEEVFDRLDNQGRSDLGVVKLNAQGITNRGRINQILNAGAAKNIFEGNSERSKAEEVARQAVLESERRENLRRLLSGETSSDTDSSE